MTTPAIVLNNFTLVTRVFQPLKKSSNFFWIGGIAEEKRRGFEVYIKRGGKERGKKDVWCGEESENALNMEERSRRRRRRGERERRKRREGKRREEKKSNHQTTKPPNHQTRKNVRCFKKWFVESGQRYTSNTFDKIRKTQIKSSTADFSENSKQLELRH